MTGQQALWTRRRMISCGAGAALAVLGIREPLAPALRVGDPSQLAAPASVEFVDADLGRFAAAIQSIENGTLPEVAFRRYLDEGSAGLRAYARIYNVTVERFTERFSTHKPYYLELAAISDHVRDQYSEIRGGVAKLTELAPHTPLVPVFLFIGVMGHGATPREVSPEGGEQSLGVLIPVELVGLTAEPDTRMFPGASPGRIERLPWLVCHELAHVSQIRLQGLEHYRRIYREASWGTHLAFAIREGAADLLANRATASLLLRHRFVREHEVELWAEFSELLDRPIAESTGWFGSPPGESGTDRPRALGYGIGWAICEYYHDQAVDKEAALLTILSASEPNDFDRIVAPYHGRF